MRWKYALRVGQESRKCRKSWKFFSKSSQERQISEDSCDYNVSILYSYRGPGSCKEGWQILKNSTVYMFHFSDKFLPRFSVAGILLRCCFGEHSPAPIFLTCPTNSDFPSVIQNCLNLSQGTSKLLHTSRETSHAKGCYNSGKHIALHWLKE